MKKLIQLTSVIAITFGFIACGSQSKKTEPETQKTEEVAATPERPTDAELHAYKAFHHTRYMVQTSEQAGGTNKLLHTKQLPTEGSDPVVTPALDHLYSKAVIDLTEGPVTVEYPDDIVGRYWSIHITDQEHYTIFDEMRPIGKYTFVRKGKEMVVPEGAKVIECPGDYPHLFIRIQVKTAEDMVNTLAIQERIILTGVSKEFNVAETEYVKHVIETHDIYSQNKGLLESVLNFNENDYNKVFAYVGERVYTIADNRGAFGPIDSNEPNSNDPEIRAAAIIGHLGLPAEHAIYIPQFLNCEGKQLNGDKKEVFTFSYKPLGVKEFWSITRYSAITRNTLPDKNDLFNAYNTKPDENGNITISFSAENPNDGTYWIPVNVGEPYYFIARYYGPDLNNLPKNPCD